MKLSIIVPIYNEQATVLEILKKVCDLPVEKEIIVVNDGSTDETEILLQQFIRQIKYIKHGHNLGRGAAIRTGLTAASGEYVVFQDADLEYDPADMAVMLEKTADDKVAAVFGSRIMRKEKQGYWHYVLGARFLTLVVNVLYGSNLSDLYTCYKLVRRSILETLRLQSDGFELEAELTCKLLKKSFSIEEVAISYNPRSFAQGKKIRFRDGLVGLWTILRCRF